MYPAWGVRAVPFAVPVTGAAKVSKKLRDARKRLGSWKML